MDSTTSITSNKDNNNIFELENQFILRMPAYKSGTLNPSTIALREALKTGSSDLKDRLFISLDTETRKGCVKFDNEVFKARLVDLPCIIESLKTLDKKTFYKTSDICQMLVCKADDDNETNAELYSSGEDADVDSLKKKPKVSALNSNNNAGTQQEINKKFLWLHGVTPSLKNARKKRFRKVAKKKIIDYAEIEEEVKRLFKEDRDALKIDYEVIYIDEPQQQGLNEDEEGAESTKKEILEMNDDSMLGFNNADTTNNNTKLEDDAHELNTDESNDTLLHSKKLKLTTATYAKTSSFDFLIGDVSSSSGSDDGDESLIQLSKNNKKKMVKIKKLEEEEQQQNVFDMMADDESTNLESPPTSVQAAHRQSAINEMLNDDMTNNMLFDEQTSNMGVEDNFDSSSLLAAFDMKKSNNDKLNRLLDELDEIKLKRQKQQEEINQISNPVLKSRLLPLLNELIEEVKNKEVEIENFKNMMNE